MKVAKLKTLFTFLVFLLFLACDEKTSDSKLGNEKIISNTQNKYIYQQEKLIQLNFKSLYQNQQEFTKALLSCENVNLTEVRILLNSFIKSYAIISPYLINTELKSKNADTVLLNYQNLPLDEKGIDNWVAHSNIEQTTLEAKEKHLGFHSLYYLLYSPDIKNEYADSTKLTPKVKVWLETTLSQQRETDRCNILKEINKHISNQMQIYKNNWQFFDQPYEIKKTKIFQLNEIVTENKLIFKMLEQSLNTLMDLKLRIISPIINNKECFHKSQNCRLNLPFYGQNILSYLNETFKSQYSQLTSEILDSELKVLNAKAFGLDDFLDQEKEKMMVIESKNLLLKMIRLIEEVINQEIEGKSININDLPSYSPQEENYKILTDLNDKLDKLNSIFQKQLLPVFKNKLITDELVQ